MGTVNLSSGSAGGMTTDRPVIPTDMYRMKCIEAAMKDNTFEKPNKDGTQPQKISTVWEVTALTEEQSEIAEEREEKWIGLRIWKDFAPFYGDTKDGPPSKFKEFIDSLRAQGYLENFDPEAFDLNDLVGVEQKVSVLNYTKTMGPNTGDPGNKIVGFASLRTPKKNGTKPAPRTGDAETDLF